MMIILAVVVLIELPMEGVVASSLDQGFLPGAELSVVVSMIGMEGQYAVLRALKDRIYSTVFSICGSFGISTHTNGQQS